MPALRGANYRDNADGRMPLFLELSGLRGATEAKDWRLLCVLQLRQRQVPAKADGEGLLQRLTRRYTAPGTSRWCAPIRSFSRVRERPLLAASRLPARPGSSLPRCSERTVEVGFRPRAVVRGVDF